MRGQIAQDSKGFRPQREQLASPPQLFVRAVQTKSKKVDDSFRLQKYSPFRALPSYSILAKLQRNFRETPEFRRGTSDVQSV